MSRFDRVGRRPFGVGCLVVAASLLAFAAAPAESLAGPCDAPVVNKIACENSKPGAAPSTWQVDGAGSPDLQGFATSMSVNVGQTISFKISAADPNYHIDIYRIGYYGGDGARLIQGLGGPTGTSTQPVCQQFADTGLIDCGNWAVSASWTVPSDAVSGVYTAHLVNNSDPTINSQIIFVVRDDASHSAILVQTSDETWEAYNTYGGNSLYTCAVVCPPGNPAAYKGAFKVSYNRPFHTAEDDYGRSWFFTGPEYPMVRFLERNGYDISYASGVDVSSNPSILLNHKMLLFSGHDEYWSKTQRANVEAARDAGVNLAFFTGNEVFWKTRFEPSADGSNTPNRTLVTYKDTHFTTPQDPVEWTGTWRDPRFTTPSSNTPENALTGQSFVVNSGTSTITVPDAYKALRLWRNTAPGPSTLAPATLGYEWDVDADNGYRPPGEFDLSSTTASNLQLFTDYGSTTKTGGTATHSLTEYRAPSGALVFGAGTVQWAWGLDDAGPDSEDPNMQQATVNLLADMGAQPSTLMPGIASASASTDTTPPTSTITNVPSTVADGTQVTISGTASDSGGGVVAGVEISSDGGTRWHPATLTSGPSQSATWSYNWIAHGNPSTTIKTRAVDDSGNLETPGVGSSVSVTCPCSLWGPNWSVLTSDQDSGDPTSVEVGVKFTSDKFGTISGLRFYKAATNTGTHIGTLWSATGQQLAQATFTGETASGWQTVTFSSPVQVQPNTTYVASYHAPSGHYSATPAYFYRAPAPGPNGGAVVDSPPLHGVQNAGTTVNGVYSYGANPAFPTNTFGAANYWVDVIFTPADIPGAVNNVTATSGGQTSANVTWSAPTSGGPVTSYQVTPYIGSTPQAPTTITGSPPNTTTTITGLTNGTTYTFTVRALNPNGSGPESAHSNQVTPLTPVAPSVPQSVSAQPASQSALVTWAAPQSNGDSAITGYTVTPYIGNAAQTAAQAGASATSATVSGLTNGTSYTFQVTANNAYGTSPPGSSSAIAPEATIYDFATPGTPDSGDGSSVEVGVKFTADFNGSITGVRFYRSSANIGTHIGNLWSSTGTLLARATFTGETGSGWQTVTFANPVAVTAGTTYVASYFAPKGHYAVTSQGLATAVDNAPLHAVANSTSANGVFVYSGTSTFPTGSFRASNYWVDVLYAVPAPGQVTNVSAQESGSTSAIVTWSAPASGGPVSSYTITPYVGGVAQTPTTISGGPPATQTSITGLTTGATYTFTVRASNANGSGAESAQSNSVTPVAAVAPTAPTGVVATPATGSAQVSWTAPFSDGGSPITGYTITPYIRSNPQTPVSVGSSTTSKTVTGLTNGTAYTFQVTATNAVGTSPASAASAGITPEDTVLDFTTPATIDSGDGRAVTMGMKFQTDFAGTVLGVRFYKAAANTGTHVGALWTASGTVLAQATSSGETASGWQSVLFSNPVSIAPNTTYVVSYYAPQGHYSVTSGGFNNAIDKAPLHGLSNSTSANGVFSYGASSTFPTSSAGASNYGVDVLFQPASAPGTPTNVTATAGSAAATVSWNAASTGGPATSYVVIPYIGSIAQTPKTVNGSPPATTTTVSGLTPGTSYTFTVGATNPSGSSSESSPSGAVVPTGAVAPGTPTGVTARADSTSALVSWNAPGSDGGSPITSYRITPYVGSTAQSPTQVNGATTNTRITGLTNGTTYTFTITATNSIGDGPESGASNAVTPLSSIFGLGTPATVDAGDTKSTVLGVKFNTDVAGSITGIRFYKSSANTGSHVGALWTATGTQLAQGAFTGESSSGWQTLTFTTPVPVSAGTTYVATYLAPKGHYSTTAKAFASSPFDSPPLHALANGTSVNGVYSYSSTSIFPTSTFNSTNYWVDVLFAPGG